MNQATEAKDYYDEAGIRDLAEFYAERFFTGGVFDAAYFHPLNRFHIQYARTMWVYDNVRGGSRLLDIGCGEGLLALLRRKGVSLTGVDFSPQLAEVARRNGYEEVRVAELDELPFPDASFDYVASLDVIGHIEFAEKDALLREIRRVLRPGGVTLHGIETFDATRFGSYDSMTEAERAAFVRVDGHIGLETESETANRFQGIFRHVKWESRYALCLSSEEFLKQAENYGRPFETDFLEYLRGLSFRERRAFDMAMGYVFAKISDLNIRLPHSGLYMLLKASDAPLGSFYNEHRDRRELFGTDPAALDGAARDVRSRAAASPASAFCLDRSPRATFDDGWYSANLLPPVARWMSGRGRITVRTTSASSIRLDLTTHIPELRAKPMAIEFFAQGVKCAALSLFNYGWLEVEMRLPESLRVPDAAGALTLEIHASRIWRPSAADAVSDDDRELSIAVCNIELHS